MTRIYDKEKEQVVDTLHPDIRVWRDGQLVFKVDPGRCNEEWRSKMREILKVYSLSAFKDFTKDGYITHYIDGADLHGKSPFSPSGGPIDSCLTTQQKVDVLSIYADVVRIGKLLGFTFGDVTCGNILTTGQSLYLIDYTPIVPYPLSVKHAKIWYYSLNLLFGS